jgi:hypothetical protein
VEPDDSRTPEDAFAAVGGLDGPGGVAAGDTGSAAEEG